MNSPDVLYFQCQACGQQLSVPIALAGVTGPCPACHGQITAPTALEAARAAALALTKEEVADVELSPPPKTRIPASLVQSPPRRSDAALASSPVASATAAAAADTVQKSTKTVILEPRSVVETVLQDQGAVKEKVRFSHAQVGGAEPGVGHSAIPQHKARVALPPKRSEPPVGTEAGSESGPVTPANVSIPDPVAAAAVSESLTQSGAGAGLPLRSGNRGHGLQQVARYAGEQERPIGNLLERNMGMREPKPWTLPKEPSGRAGIFVVALLLVTLGIAGVSYAFQDQLRVMWHIYFPQKDEDARPKGPSRTAAATTRQTKPPTSSNAVSSVPVQPTTPEQKPVVPAPAPQMLPPHPRIEEAPTIPRAEDKVKAVEAPPAEKAAAAPSRQVPTLFLKPPAEMKGAVEALREFLSARTWRERSQWVQWAETVRPLMEQYYLSNEDRAVEVAEVVPIPKYDQGGEGELQHYVFELIGGDIVDSLPVMIEETKEGWKVDWLTFIEGKDRLLEKFFSAYRDQPARFRVLARRKPFIENRDLPNIESKMCFEVQPPSPGFVGYVYAEAGTPLASQLDRVLGWEVLSAALVVELRWQRIGDQQWVEIVDVPYLNWRTPNPMQR